MESLSNSIHSLIGLKWQRRICDPILYGTPITSACLGVHVLMPAFVCENGDKAEDREDHAHFQAPCAG